MLSSSKSPQFLFDFNYDNEQQQHIRNSPKKNNKLLYFEQNQKNQKNQKSSFEQKDNMSKLAHNPQQEHYKFINGRKRSLLHNDTNNNTTTRNNNGKIRRIVNVNNKNIQNNQNNQKNELLKTTSYVNFNNVNMNMNMNININRRKIQKNRLISLEFMDSDDDINDDDKQTNKQKLGLQQKQQKQLQKNNNVDINKQQHHHKLNKLNHKMIDILNSLPHNNKNNKNINNYIDNKLIQKSQTELLNNNYQTNINIKNMRKYAVLSKYQQNFMTKDSQSKMDKLEFDKEVILTRKNYEKQVVQNKKQQIFVSHNNNNQLSQLISTKRVRSVLNKKIIKRQFHNQHQQQQKQVQNLHHSISLHNKNFNKNNNINNDNNSSNLIFKQRPKSRINFIQQNLEDLSYNERQKQQINQQKQQNKKQEEKIMEIDDNKTSIVNKKSNKMPKLLYFQCSQEEETNEEKDVIIKQKQLEKQVQPQNQKQQHNGQCNSIQIPNQLSPNQTTTSSSFSESISSCVFNEQQIINFPFEPLNPRQQQQGYQFQIIHTKSMMNSKSQFQLYSYDRNNLHNIHNSSKTKVKLLVAYSLGLSLQSSKYHIYQPLGTTSSTLSFNQSQTGRHVANVYSNFKRNQFTVEKVNLQYEKPTELLLSTYQYLGCDNSKVMEVYVPEVMSNVSRNGQEGNHNNSNNKQHSSYVIIKSPTTSTLRQARRLFEYKPHISTFKSSQNQPSHHLLLSQCIQQYHVRQSHRNLIIINEKKQIMMFIGKKQAGRHLIAVKARLSLVQVLGLVVAHIG